MSNSEIKRIVFGGSLQQVKSLSLDKKTLSQLSGSVRAQYFKRLQKKE